MIGEAVRRAYLLYENLPMENSTKELPLLHKDLESDLRLTIGIRQPATERRVSVGVSFQP